MRLLAVDDRGRDRRPGRRGRHRRRQRRRDLGARVARRRRRLPALDQGLDGDHERAAAAQPYFIRLSKTGDPNAAITYNVGNGGPTLDQRAVIDAGFLELAPPRRAPGERPGRRRIAAGRRRHDQDAHAERAGLAPLQRRRLRRRRQRRPPVGAERKGTGHLWPVLSAERGEHALETGDAAAAASLLDAWRASRPASASSPSRTGSCPTSPHRRSAPTRRPRRSASRTASRPARRRPLTWSAGPFVRLFADIAADKLLDQPAATVDRYVRTPRARPR